jgi:hypothetical protein
MSVWDWNNLHLLQSSYLIGVYKFCVCREKNISFALSLVTTHCTVSSMLNVNVTNTKIFIIHCRFDYSQTYIPHGYKELRLGPTEDGQVLLIYS